MNIKTRLTRLLNNPLKDLLVEMAAAIVIVSVLAVIGSIPAAATTSFESVAIRNSMVSFINRDQSAVCAYPFQCNPEDRKYSVCKLVFSESQGGVTVKTRL